jgi:zinc protease
MKATILLAAALALIAAVACRSSQYSADFRSNKSSGPETIVHKTPSGLTVLIRRAPGIGVATIDAWVKTGSANEPSALGGVSHFLEHMLFKGTAKMAPGDMDRLVEGIGGVLNAGTSMDFTHYYMTVPAHEATVAIGALADALAGSTLPQEELDKERGVVLEEISRKEDDPYGYLYETLHETAFLSGPYKESVLGKAENIESVTREQMLDYYHRYYTPENIVLLAVGDIEEAEIRRETDRAFAGFNRAARPFDGIVCESQWAAGTERIIEKDVREIYSALAFPAPSMSEPRNVVAADILQTAMATGRASRLVRELKERRQLATSISVHFPTQAYDSMMMVLATLKPEKSGEYREALNGELATLAKKKLTGEELDRAKRLLINAHLFSQETTGGAASVLGYYYTLTGSLDFEADYIKTVESITAGEVRKIAKRILDPDKAVRVELHPK